MANRVILSPEYFPDPTRSRAISGGFIYVGIVDLDPKIDEDNQKQISVLQENGTIIPVAQPIETNAGGTPQYNGSPVTILVDGSYSLRVDDKHGAQAYYVPKNSESTDDSITIETIDDLRGATGGFQNQSATVLGYYTAGDGGGGPTRIWDEGKAPGFYVDNGGSIIVPGDGSAAWIWGDISEVRARWYGVKGDGIADDTSRLNTIKDPSVIIDDGLDCLISEEFNINTAGQEWSGRGAKLTKAGVFVGTTMIRLNAENIKVEELTLDGTDNTVDGFYTQADVADGFKCINNTIYNTAYGISTLNAANVLIEGCTISLVAQSAIRNQPNSLTRSLSNIRILNNNIDLSDVGLDVVRAAILVRGHIDWITDDVLIAGNTIKHISDPVLASAEGCEFRYTTNTRFTNNYVEGGSMIVSAAYSNDSVIDSNAGLGQNFYAIEIGTGLPPATKGYVVSNNIIDGNHLLAQGIALNSPAGVFLSQCSITGNTIRNVNEFGIRINFDWDNVSITGNVIALSSDSTYVTPTGITSVGVSKNIAITGNIIDGGSVMTIGIRVADLTGGVISSNVLENFAGAATGIGIASNSVTDDISITGNSIVGLSSNGIVKISSGGTFGNYITAYSNPEFRIAGTRGTNYLNMSRDMIDAWGAGTPEASVTAGVGSIYVDWLGGIGTTFYIKESGVGNTGWIAK